MNDDLIAISLKAHASLLRLFDAFSQHDIDMFETHLSWIHFQLYRSALEKLGVPQLSDENPNIVERFDDAFSVAAVQNKSVQGFMKVVEQHSDFIINTKWKDSSELKQHLEKLNCLTPDKDEFDEAHY